MKKFVSLNNSGGLGNQLALLMHQLAFCKESGAALAVNNLEKNRNDFVFNDTAVSFLHRDNIGRLRYSILNTVKAVLNLFAKNSRLAVSNILLINSSTEGYRELLHKSRYLLITSSWNVRFHELVKKHASRLRHDVQFSAAVELQATDFISRHQLNAGDLKIGVHIRRGDYEQFEGGRYFYSMEHYYEVMNKMTELFPDRKIRFIIFSNETNRFVNPLDHDLVYSDQPAIVDMCLMSKLDLLVGPPSTFSGSASFLGNVPMLELKDRNKKIEQQAFKVYEI